MLRDIGKKTLIAAFLLAEFNLPTQAAITNISPGLLQQAELQHSSGQIVLAQVRRPRHRHHARPGIRPIRPVVVVRPYRRRPYYGRVIAGVVIGSVITAAVAGSIPRAPSPDLCWYWHDSYQTEGYWDYCQ